jgi:hypothetical protein
MASLRARLLAVGVTVAALLSACSPEASRDRDGGPGADPGNKLLVEAPYVDPKAADTTLWPRRAPTPLERFEAGTMYSPVSLDPTPAAGPPSEPERRAFKRSASDPRRPERP